MKGKNPSRRLSYRSVVPTLLVAGVLLPFLFIRTAFLALDAGAATICPSISCLGWRIRPLLFRGSADTSLELVKEINRVYLEAEERGETMDPKFIEEAPESWDHLLAEMTAAAAASYKNVDVKTFLLKTKAMLFPKLKRVILLDDDVVVQRDLAPFWDIDLSGNIIGAVGLADDRNRGHCPGKKLGHYLNFSNPSVRIPLPRGLEKDQCAWLSGMNIFNLIAWRRTNITVTFQQMLKLNRESGFSLWRLGWLPPALIAFHGNVHPINPSWHLSELGHRVPNPGSLNSAVVLHFNGPRKPWLEIAFPELQKIWMNHLNHSNEILTSCRVVK